jgi:hypothetical protein
MSKPRTITLLVAGFGLILAAPLFLSPTDMIRPVRKASGEPVLRPDGRVLFEHDTIAQIKHDWLSELLGAVGLICLIWVAMRGARYLYDRVHKNAAPY